MKIPLNIGILFGGRSCEHEVSVTSARSIFNTLDRNKYNVYLIGIDKSGYWHLADNMDSLVENGSVNPRTPAPKTNIRHSRESAPGNAAVAASKTNTRHSRESAPGNAAVAASKTNTRHSRESDCAKTQHSSFLRKQESSKIAKPTGFSTSVSLGLHHHGNLTPQGNSPAQGAIPALDVVFPVLHGTFGEDGTLQGLLEMAGLPYVGCGVAASALAMDKALAKKVFASANIAQAPYNMSTVRQWQQDKNQVIEKIENELGYAVFVKPANLGSSVGISKAKNQSELVTAIEHALKFDNKIVIEQAMENCYEIECAILGNALHGNKRPQASILGEIIPGAEFYNYETKYIDDKSHVVIPAQLNAKTTSQVQQLAIKAFKAIDGCGLARADFFVHKDTHEITLNEINTLPGFTPISMYPQLWAASAIPYPQLLDRLIDLALENHQSKQLLKREF